MYDIAHGLANAIILPYVLEYYGESAHKRLAELAEAASITQPGMTDAQKAEAFYCCDPPAQPGYEYPR